MIYIQVHGNWIVGFQKPDRFVVLRDGNGIFDAGLALERLREAKMVGEKCVLILSRAHWLISIEEKPDLKRRELRTLGILSEEMLCARIPEDIFSGNMISRYIYAVAIPQSTVNEISVLLEQLDLEICELRVSSFESAKSTKGELVLSLDFFPDQRWELNLAHKGHLIDCYFGSTLRSEELTNVLSIMLFKQLTQDLGLESDPPSDIFLTKDSLNLKVELGDNVPENFQIALKEIPQRFMEFGIKVECSFETKPTYFVNYQQISWPMAAFFGADKKGKSASLVISLKTKRKKTTSLGMVAVGMVLAVTLGLLGINRWIGEQLNSMEQSLQALAAPMSQIHEEREELELLEHRLGVGLALVDDRDLALQIIYQLNSILPSYTEIERLQFNEQKIELTLYATSVARVLSALEYSQNFIDVEVVSPITNETRDGTRLERVSLRFRFDTRNGGELDETPW
ncbi:MAG: PilN domain-containing protein [Firmicutes bacterium]|nr:PilN domain-containing protein [Bacillota bacterium]